MTRRRLAQARVYDEVRTEDGTRVLVDRLWPRGLSKANAHLDLWLRDIAPSTELRRWYGHRAEAFEEFSRRYRAELAGDAHQEALAELVALARKGSVVLLTATKEVAISSVPVLADVVTEALSAQHGA